MNGSDHPSDLLLLSLPDYLNSPEAAGLHRKLLRADRNQNHDTLVIPPLPPAALLPADDAGLHTDLYASRECGGKHLQQAS